MASATAPSPAEYKDVLLFLATAGVAVPLAQRLRIPPVLGFLAAGAVLGPFGLGALAGQVHWLGLFTITDANQVQVLGELGVVFLMFTIGLELSWERLRRLRRWVFGLGLAQVALCTAAIGLIAWLIGLSPAAATALGAGLALSSTAIVAPILTARGQMSTLPGRATFAILLAQDLAVAVLIFVVGFMAGGAGEDPPLLRLGWTLGSGLLGLAVIVAGGRLLLRPMFRSAARGHNEDLFFALCLLVVIVAGLAAQVAGLSMALGAFVAGVLLAETEFRRQVEAVIEPFKGLLLGLFFVSVGIGLDFGQLAARPLLVLALLAGSLALKGVVTFALARAFRLKNRPALETALAIAPAGEFAFVIVAQALPNAGRDAGALSAALVAATLSMVLAPLLMHLGGRLAQQPSRSSEAAAEAEPLPDAERPRVILAGYGRVGRMVGDMLSRHEVEWIALDADVDVVADARKAEAPVFFGDATNPEVLRRFGLDHARAMVITMDTRSKVEGVAALARQLRPDLRLIARARDARQAAKLYELGVTDAVPETIEASLQLAENTLVDVGVPMGLVIASIHERREEFRNRFRDAIDGDHEPRALAAGSARARLTPRPPRRDR